MRLTSYLKDKLIEIILVILLMIFISLLLLIFNVSIVINILIISLIFLTFIFIIIYDFLRRKTFYNNIEKALINLDKKFYLTEIIKDSSFLEGKLLIDYIYDINKSYIEKLNSYKYSTEEFKEYIELWCHEIKTPLATSKLILENNTGNNIEEIEKIEQYVEQVLYFARSENVEKDYIIKETNLKDIVNNVIKKNKKDLINKKIKVSSLENDIYVNTDSKWLEFIINQIVINSIKYSKDKNSKLIFICESLKDNVILKIEDNGIGINKEELEKVFDKGFTGSNGRKKYSSTGIGLYLCKKLCNKLGHNILIDSKLNENTIVTIILPNSSLIKDIK